MFTCYLSANIILDENGEIVGSMGVSRDISREKKLTEQLEQQNQKNAKLIEELVGLSRIAINVANGIMILDPTGKIKWSNESFTRITGYSQNELIGFKPSDLFRVSHFFRESYDKLVADGPQFDVPIQISYYHKNGDLYWLLVESAPVYDNEGNLFEIIDICTEISNQKRAELALVESESNFRQMYETIEDVFFLFNVIDRQYEYISPNSETIMGVASDYFYNGIKIFTRQVQNGVELK